MAHRLTAANRRNKQLCRLNRAPVIAAELSAMGSTADYGKAPLLTVALGDLVTTAQVRPLGNPYLRSTLAQALGDYYRTINPSMTAVQQRAIVFSEMTMSCLPGGGNDINSMNQARARLRTFLAMTPPSAPVLIATFNRMYEKLSAISPSGMMSLAEFPEIAEALDTQPNMQIRANAFTAWRSGAHAFSPEDVLPQEAADAWEDLLTIELAVDGGEEVDMSLTAEQRAALAFDPNPMLQAWSTYTLERMCAVFEAIAYTTEATCEKNLLHALFTCLSHLTKGQNKTSSWITTRFQRIQATMPGVPDLDSNIVQEFSKIHSNTPLTAEQIFAVLAASYKVLEGTAASSLCWVIEQAVASNITSALIVADTISKMVLFPIDQLIEMSIPANQFKALVRLALHTYVNRFGTLLGPSVTVKEYADLAYLCMSIQRKSAKGAEKTRLLDYAADYSNFLTKNKADLDGVAGAIKDLSGAIASRSVAPEAILKRYLPNCAGIFEYGGEDSIYIDLGNIPQRGGSADPNRPPEALPEGRLPRDLRGNQRYYKKMGLEELPALMLAQESANAKAFRHCMSLLSTCGYQSATTFENLISTSYRLPYTPLVAEDRAFFEAWLGEEVGIFLGNHVARTGNATAEEDATIARTELYPQFFRSGPVEEEEGGEEDGRPEEEGEEQNPGA